MKVSVADFEIHLFSFVKKMANAMPSALHKYGVATGLIFKLISLENEIVGALSEDGMVDLDLLKKANDVGFEVVGGSIVMTLPGSKLLKIPDINFVLKKEDMDEFFAGFTPQTKEVDNV